MGCRPSHQTGAVMGVLPQWKVLLEGIYPGAGSGIQHHSHFWPPSRQTSNSQDKGAKTEHGAQEPMVGWA